MPTITFIKRLKMFLKIPERSVSNDHNYTLKQTVKSFQKPENYRRTHSTHTRQIYIIKKVMLGNRKVACVGGYSFAGVTSPPYYIVNCFSRLPNNHLVI